MRADDIGANTVKKNEGKKGSWDEGKQGKHEEWVRADGKVEERREEMKESKEGRENGIRHIGGWRESDEQCWLVRQR